MEDINEVQALMVLCNTPLVGGRIARNLIDRFGSAQAVLKASKFSLEKIQGVGDTISNGILRKDGLSKAESYIQYCKKNKIRILHYKSMDYPNKLRLIDDCPLILYQRGNLDLNAKLIISIVGTRKPSLQGKFCCEKLISGLVDTNIGIASGLAYGVDIIAHKKSLENKIPTIGVMAHGHGTLYPAIHKKIADEMLENGALLTEFPPDQTTERNNFPARNRIIAGIATATIVIESGKKGGSMITAEFANQYNREVLAIPGRPGDIQSKGCNYLIKNHKAQLIEDAEDVKYLLDLGGIAKKENQLQLFEKLEGIEKKIVETVNQYGTCLIDRLIVNTNLSLGELSTYLLGLECKGILACLPGKRYILAC